MRYRASRLLLLVSFFSSVFYVNVYFMFLHLHLLRLIGDDLSS